MRGRSAHRGGPREPVSVEIITYAPTLFYHCQHCELAFQQVGLGESLHRREAREALPEDLTEQFRELSDWVTALVHAHGDDVSIRVIDAASIEGFWKSIRHRVRRYPAVILDGREKWTGTDFTAVNALVEGRFSAGREGEEVSEGI